MDLLIAGLVGVVVGGMVTVFAVRAILQRRSDRELIERRLRACGEYRECLGDMARVLNHQGDDPAVVEQAWRNVALFSREYRLTSWLFDRPLRGRLDRVIAELDAESQSLEANGGAGGRAAQLLCEKFLEVDRVLSRELERQRRDYRAFRFIGSTRTERDGGNEHSAGAIEAPAANGR